MKFKSQFDNFNITFKFKSNSKRENNNETENIYGPLLTMLILKHC